MITAAALFAIYWMIQGAIKTHALLPILIAFLIAQIFILSRAWIRIGLQAAQMDYFCYWRPRKPSGQEGQEPATVAESDTEPVPEPTPPAEE